MKKTFYIHDVITNIITGEELRYITGRDNYIRDEEDVKYLTGYQRRGAAINHMHSSAAYKARIIRDDGDVFVYIEGDRWIHNCSIKEKIEEDDE